MGRGVDDLGLCRGRQSQTCNPCRTCRQRIRTKPMLRRLWEKNWLAKVRGFHGAVLSRRQLAATFYRACRLYTILRFSFAAIEKFPRIETNAGREKESAESIHSAQGI